MLLTYTLAAAPDAVYPCLADMRRFVALHPSLFAATPGRDGLWHCRERIRLLGMPLTFGYPVRITAKQETGEIFMRSRINFLVKLELHFWLTATAPGTQVKEQIIIYAPGLIRRVFSSIIIRAHRIFFSRLESALAEAHGAERV